MTAAVVVTFILVYAAMIAGGLPALALDRTGAALLGAIAVIAFGMPTAAAADAVDMPTIILLFAMMVVSAQFRLAGFYTFVARRLVSRDLTPKQLLAVVVAVTGGFSTVLTNDIVCLALAPVLIEGCARRRLDPVPFLLALACAANVGSAATLIGNPQNILIGQARHLSFTGYMADASVPVIFGLVLTWVVIALRYRGRWEREVPAHELPTPSFDRWQSIKGVAVVAVLMVIFVFVHDVPREHAALVGAGVVLLSRHTASRKVIALVDWPLLVLFASLFVVNGALEHSGVTRDAIEGLRAHGLDPSEPAILFGASVVLSNTVSNVPAVMLLLPSALGPRSGALLALSSTFAGNLFLVGSLANIIVVNRARELGVTLDFRAHLRVGPWVALGTLAAAALWLWLLT